MRPTLPMTAKTAAAAKMTIFFQSRSWVRWTNTAVSMVMAVMDTDAAATFGDFKIEAAVGGGEGGAHGLDFDADDVGEKSDDAGNEELQTERRLLHRAHRDHKNQKRAREQDNPGHTGAPQIIGRTKNQEWDGRQRHARLQAPDGKHKTDNPNENINKALCGTLPGSGADFVAMVPNQEQRDGEYQFPMLLVSLGIPRAPGPDRRRFLAAEEKILETEKPCQGSKNPRQQERVDRILTAPLEEKGEFLKEANRMG